MSRTGVEVAAIVAAQSGHTECEVSGGVREVIEVTGMSGPEGMAPHPEKGTRERESGKEQPEVERKPKVSGKSRAKCFTEET